MISIGGYDHRSWDKYKLKEYGDFAEKCTAVETYVYGDDTTAGWWYYVDEEIHEVPDEGKFRTVYEGTWGSTHSPGASHFTHAGLYDVDDEEEMKDFEDYVRHLKDSETQGTVL
jgi:hypothetical protein